MAYQNEDQCSAFTLFGGYLGDGRFLERLLADAQGAMEGKATACPHPTRQINGRHEATTLGVTVFRRVVEANGRQKIEPVPRQRQGYPCYKDVELVERCGEALRR